MALESAEEACVDSDDKAWRIGLPALSPDATRQSWFRLGTCAPAAWPGWAWDVGVLRWWADKASGLPGPRPGAGCSDARLMRVMECMAVRWAQREGRHKQTSEAHRMEILHSHSHA